MTKRMLIDATHAEETRVVVLDGNRLEDFDVETSTKRQLKGNIYLAKVVRVEPSLQAAFVEYGGNRHGFLAFSEIHPDYYQIPIADRQRLVEMQAEEARREEEEEDLELALSQAAEGGAPAPAERQAAPNQREPRELAGTDHPGAAEPVPAEAWASPAVPLLTRPAVLPTPVEAVDTPPAAELAEAPAATEPDPEPAPIRLPVAEAWAMPGMPRLLAAPSSGHAMPLAIRAETRTADVEDADEAESFDGDQIEVLPPPETVGGGSENDSGDEPRERRMPPRFLRNYKIQEVIRRRQILLVQVVKEERGTKGAALTTYLSLAGRFGVLMPNSPRGGGISRKITSAADRRRLKEVMQELDIPRGMGLIVRTAGANRPKPEIKRDCEYLLRLWDDIREHTMKSVAPALIYEEASLIKRAIRDVYSRDIDEILVDGEEGWRAAHDFMRMLMPAHAKKVQLWRDGGQPLFARHQVEAQLDAMLMPTVQLRSGGYLVINQAEALVAIDVNSGRSTRERNIEETALRTNLEAADEVARQLRLRDLAGLIVIDFIDMESKRHNAMVERRIKEALKNDRARIQVGHISHFGLLEMSRQRLRPSLAETSFIPCPHCGGTGHVRSTESAAIHVLRGIEDEGGRRRSAEIVVHVSTPVALYLLNHKRERLREIELRYAMRVIIAADDAQIAPQFRIERIRVRSADEIPPVVTPDRMLVPAPVLEDEAEEDDEAIAEDEESDAEDEADETGAEAGASGDEAERRRKRRRRRRRNGRRDDQAAPGPDQGPDSDETAEPGLAVGDMAAEQHAPSVAEAEAATGEAQGAEPAIHIPGTQTDETQAADGQSADADAESAEIGASAEDDLRNRRRGRRGGRRRRRDDGTLSPYAEPGADQPDLPPVYAGPTPADPFGGRAFDIFDVMDQVERAAERSPRAEVAMAAAEIVNTGAIGTGSSQAELPAGLPDSAAPSIVEAEPDHVRASVATEASATEGVMAGTPAASAIPEAIANGAAPEPAPQPAPEAVQTLAEEAAMAAGDAAPDPNLSDAPVTPAPAPIPAEPEQAPIVAEAAPAEPPPPEPAIKPILVGAETEAPVAKKRGWWRR